MEMVNKLLKLNYKVIVVPYIENLEFKLIHICQFNLQEVELLFLVFVYGERRM